MFQSPEKNKKAAAEHVDNAVSDIKSAKGELKNAKDSAESGARAALREAGDQAENTLRNLRAQAHEAGEKVQHFLHDRREDLDHARDRAERVVRANPIGSTVAAFVSGLIIARLFKR